MFKINCVLKKKYVFSIYCNITFLVPPKSKIDRLVLLANHEILQRKVMTCLIRAGSGWLIFNYSAIFVVYHLVQSTVKQQKDDMLNKYILCNLCSCYIALLKFANAKKGKFIENYCSKNVLQQYFAWQVFYSRCCCCCY